MNQSAVGRGALIGVIFVLVVIAAVQVLPQVDLADTAFHEDTAPLVSKFRIVSAPSAAITAALSPHLAHSTAKPAVIWLDASREAIHSPARSLTTLLCCLLC